MHKAFDIYLHITWHTWRRQRMVDRRSAADVAAVIVEAAERCRVHVLVRAILSDHVHILASFRPDETVSSFVRHCKSESARRINQRMAGFRWARGYYVASVARGALRQVNGYLARQFRRHPDRIPA